MFSMGDCFRIEEIRSELINELKSRGYSQNEIDKLIKICDEAYNDFKIPYPTLEDLIGKIY